MRLISPLCGRLLTASLLILPFLGVESCGGDGNGDGSDGSGGSSAAGSGAVDAGLDGSSGGEPPTDGGPDAPVSSSTCGNGAVETGEDCDDDSPGCGDDCFWLCEEGPVGDQACTDFLPCNGREVCAADHTCMPGTPLADGTTCGQDRVCVGGTCMLAPDVCGDGILNRTAGEECDDNDQDDTDGCTQECLFTCITDRRPCPPMDSCLGVVTCNDATHMCDTNPLADYTPCTMTPDPGAATKCINAACTTAFCGSGVIDQSAGEECDDSNQATSDGCDFPSCRYTCDSADPTRNCAEANPCKVSGGCDDATHTCRPSSDQPDGTVCGGNRHVCIAGQCLNGFCGDGAFDSRNEECDDGNIVSGDGCESDCTVSCVSPAIDCGPNPPCRTWTCNGGVCEDVPDASRNGATCIAGAGSATCNAGACTAGTCGDGVLDTGEQCDFGAENGSNTGCETSCRRSCASAGDCTNGDGCDGNETCQSVTATNGQMGMRCNAGTEQADGTTCGTDHICLSGVCRESFCGDRYTDAGEACDPPNPPFCNLDCTLGETCDFSGWWAQKVMINVSWGGGLIEPGTGVIEQWALLQMTPTSTTEFTAVLKACGTVLPDFDSIALLGSLHFGLIFPDAMWDQATMPTFAVTGRSSNIVPGSAFVLDPVSIQLGLDMVDDFGAWPTHSQTITDTTYLTILDHDSNGLGGVSVMGKTGSTPAGGMYSLPPVDGTSLSDLQGGDRIDLVIRQIIAANGSLTTCDRVDGQVSITSIDTHIISCHNYTAMAECTPTQASGLDDGRVVYTASGGTFTTVRMPDGAAPTCADVRAVLP